MADCALTWKLKGCWQCPSAQNGSECVCHSVRGEGVGDLGDKVPSCHCGDPPCVGVLTLTLKTSSVLKCFLLQRSTKNTVQEYSCSEIVWTHRNNKWGKWGSRRFKKEPVESLSVTAELCFKLGLWCHARPDALSLLPGCQAMPYQPPWGQTACSRPGSRSAGARWV